MRDRCESYAVFSLALVLSVISAAPGIAGTGDYAWGESVTGGIELTATNDSQGFTARLGSSGLLLKSVEGDWELSLALARAGREGAMKDVLQTAPRGQAHRAEFHRDTLTEWFVNSDVGLEHGFTVAERPRGEGPLVLELKVGGDLLVLPEPGESSVAMMHPGSSLAVLQYGGLKVFDAHGRNVVARLGPAAGGEGRLLIEIDDHGVAYPITVDPLLTTSVWSSADSDDTFGVAWGDWDGDGDLDLAAGNYGQANRVYENSGGALSSVWTSADSDGTTSVAWGDWDGDGDLDLAAGNDGQPNRVYENSEIGRAHV